MWWKVWNLPIKPKLRHILWRCLHNWLATGHATKKRGMEVDDICRRCGMESETREHLLFHCQESILIWKLVHIKWDGINHLIDLFEDWWGTVSIAKGDAYFQRRLNITVYVLWHIWKARCQWQFEGQK